MAIGQSGSQQLNGAILALNAGSSSLKFGLFASRPDLVAHLLLERHQRGSPFFPVVLNGR